MRKKEVHFNIVVNADDSIDDQLMAVAMAIDKFADLMGNKNQRQWFFNKENPRARFDTTVFRDENLSMN